MPENSHTLEAEELSVVVVGSFNPAIFHPDWFLRQKLIADQDATEAKIHMVSTDLTDVQFGGLKLICLPDRFELRTSRISYAAQIQDLVVHIFTLLPHTPIKACGINPAAHFRVGSMQYWHKIGHTLAPKEQIWKELFEQPGMRSLIIEAPQGGEFGGEFNITVEPSPKYPPCGIVVRSNRHYALPVDMVHAGATELLLRFLKTEWRPACEMAGRVADLIFSKIKPDND